MIYCVCYDLHAPGRNYEPLYNAIKSYGTWWHHLDSTWFIRTDQNASQIRDFLMQFTDANDELLIFPVARGWAGYGFSEKAYEWLQNNWAS